MQRLLGLLYMAVAAVLVTASPILAEEGPSGPVVELRLQLVVATGPAGAMARVAIDNLDTSLRAIGATLNVPEPWEVTEVRGLSTAGTQNVRFQQRGQELRLLLVSLQGSVVTSADGPVLELHLRKPVADSSGIRDLGARLALVDAEIIDQQGDLLTVRLTHEPSFGRQLRRDSRPMRRGGR